MGEEMIRSVMLSPFTSADNATLKLCSFIRLTKEFRKLHASAFPQTNITNYGFIHCSTVEMQITSYKSIG